MRGPSASQASRRLPAPESLRFVTKITLPPRPPGVFAPKPSAPGNAGRSEAAGTASAASNVDEAASAANETKREKRRFMVKKETATESRHLRIHCAQRRAGFAGDDRAAVEIEFWRRCAYGCFGGKFQFVRAAATHEPGGFARVVGGRSE